MKKTRRKAPRKGKVEPAMKRLWRRLRKPLLVGGSIFILASILTGWWAAGRITTDFELREKQTTSRLMGRPYPLTPGQPGSPELLVHRLKGLDYREVQSRPVDPGTFTLGRNWIQVYLRASRDPEGEHPAQLVRLRFDRGEIRHADKDGATLEPVTMALFHGDEMEERDLVAVDEVPKHLISAILAAEDRRFYLHPGIDPGGVLRALWANLTSGSITQGGSTLTQQLAKNLYFSSRKTFTRKGAEAYAALVLESTYTKERILRAYINEIYLGQHGPVSVRGVARAARHYFGKDVAKLDLAQSALLAGMIRAPGRYNPFIHQEKAKVRRRSVLRAMHEAGVITEVQRFAAEREPLPVKKPDACSLNTRAAYVADLLEQDLEATHGEEFRYENLSIHTTIDAAYQEAAESALRNGLTQLEKRHPRLKRKQGQDPLQAALISIDLRDGGILAMVGGRGFANSQFNRVTSARRQPGSLFKPIVYLAGMTHPGDQEDEDGFGDDWWADDEADDVVHAPSFPASPSYAVQVRPFENRIAPARKKPEAPGQSIVPAKRKKKRRWFWQPREPEESEEEEVIQDVPSMPITAATVLLDTPYEVKTGGKTWAPRNWDHEFRGPVTVQRALEESLNVPTVRAAAAIGMERIIAMGHAMGIDSPLPNVPALALGTADITPLEMATAFMTIASGGKKRQPVLLRGVSSPSEVLHKTGVLGPGGRIGPGPDSSVIPAGNRESSAQAIPRKEANLMTALLEGVIENGTGRSIRTLGFEGAAAGKTGTSDGGRDLWFCAYTPRILTLVWVGFDDNAPTHLSGASGAIPIWVDYMRQIGADTKAHFESDKSLSWVAIDPANGYLAHRSCPDVRWAPFTPGTEPEKSCDLHRRQRGFWRD
jgi:membrane peptidoglycan carboxypeptidase